MMIAMRTVTSQVIRAKNLSKSDCCSFIVGILLEVKVRVLNVRKFLPRPSAMRSSRRSHLGPVLHLDSRRHKAPYAAREAE